MACWSWPQPHTPKRPDHYIDSIPLIQNEQTGARYWNVTWLTNRAGLGGETWMSIPMDPKLLPTIEFGK